MPQNTNLAYDSLQPGHVFTFFGPREGLLRRRGVAVGRVLALDPDDGVVHIRTLRIRPGTEADTEVLVGFMPVLFSVFRSSLHNLAGVGPTTDDWWPVLHEWRRRHAQGEVGAFNIPVWRAQEIAVELLLENGHTEDSAWIEWAFPKRGGADGGFNVTEIAAQERPGAGAA